MFTIEGKTYLHELFSTKDKYQGIPMCFSTLLCYAISHCYTYNFAVDNYFVCTRMINSM